MITLPLLTYSCLKNLCKCLHCSPHDNPFLKGFWFPARFQISHEETEGIVLVFFKKFLSGSGRLSHQPPDITNMRPKHCPNRFCWAPEFPGKTEPPERVTAGRGLPWPRGDTSPAGVCSSTPGGCAEKYLLPPLYSKQALRWQAG